MWWPRLEPYIEPNDNEIEEAVDEAISWRADVFVLDADLCFMAGARISRLARSRMGTSHGPPYAELAFLEYSEI